MLNKGNSSMTLYRVPSVSTVLKVVLLVVFVFVGLLSLSRTSFSRVEYLVAGQPQYLYEWGNSGGSEGEFQNPRGIAVDGDGLVYVADSYNSRVQVFESDGTFVRTWGNEGSSEGEFLNPQGITVGGDALVYVADSNNNRVQVFESDGTFVRTWGNGGSSEGEFLNPQGITVGGDGLVYIADMYNNRIQVFESDGTFVRTWGNEGSSEGEFSNSQGINVGGDGLVYVADSNNSRVQVFESDGTFVRTWGNGGSSEGEFQNPCGIAVDGDGLVYVADSYNSRVQVFESDGTFVRTWGNEGSSEGEFEYPQGITVGGDGLVYIADSDNQRIQVFGYSDLIRAGYSSADRELSPSSPGVLDQYGMSFVEDGRYWVTALSETDGGFDSQVYKLSPDKGEMHSPTFAVTWVGHGDAPSDKIVYLSVWNFETSAWEELDSQHCYEDCTLSGVKTGDEYLDPDGYLWIWAKADNEYSEAPDIIVTDFSSPPYLYWETDIDSTSQVAYDTVSHEGGSWEDYGDWGSYDPELTSSHEKHLPRLPATSYALYFRVRSCTEDYNCTTSEEYYVEYLYSCPFLFTFNGVDYDYINDISTAGSLGLGTEREQWKKVHDFATPRPSSNPEFYVKIPKGSLVPSADESGRYYDIKTTTELNEVNYYDATALQVFDHAPGVEVYPDYIPDGTYHTIRDDAPAPVWARDANGDVTNLIEKNDGVFWTSPDVGGETFLTMKLVDGDVTPENLRLVLERGKEGDIGTFDIDKLQYKIESGEFVNVRPEYEVFSMIVAGSESPAMNAANIYGTDTRVMDLSGLKITDNEIRIALGGDGRQWDIDWIAVDTSPDQEVTMTTVQPFTADLHFRGLSRLVHTNPDDPNMKLLQPDYSRLLPLDGMLGTETSENGDVNVLYTRYGMLLSMYEGGNPLTGKATRYGEVKDLLSEIDDEFVVMVQGDELELKYPIPEQPDGTERSFIYYSWDYHKPYPRAYGDTIDPLPFNNMTQYPYDTSVESYPYEQHKSYLENYNTREIKWWQDDRPVGTDLLGQVSDPVQIIHRSLNTDYLTVDVSDTSAPSVSFADFQAEVDSSTPTFRGTATENSGTVAVVLFQLDGTNGEWIPCTADDGIFDEAVEDFTCQVTSPLSAGSHALFISVSDSDGNSGVRSQAFSVSQLIQTGSMRVLPASMAWLLVGITAVGMTRRFRKNHE